MTEMKEQSNNVLTQRMQCNKESVLFEIFS